MKPKAITFDLFSARIVRRELEQQTKQEYRIIEINQSCYHIVETK